MTQISNYILCTSLLVASCQGSNFSGSNGGQSPAVAKPTTTSTPIVPTMTTTSTTAAPDGLTTDSGGLLSLVTPYAGPVKYQGNVCGSNGCGDENIQQAVDGIDFRNISATSTLNPQSVASIINQNLGKTVMTGAGTGDKWGSRIFKFRTAQVVIYDSKDVITAQPCPNNRIPTGRPKVARTSQLGQFLCAKLDPRVSLGPQVTKPANSNYGPNSDADCPANHVIMGENGPSVMNGPWSIVCSPIQVKNN